MEQQPFESQLAFVAKSGANGQGKCRGLPPTAFPSSSQFSRSLFLFYVAQVFRPEAFDFGWARSLRCVFLIRPYLRRRKRNA
jgi:hypothetical protein